jgi:tRNA uridine 5-carboxymethylaminomethyl modification enzyme
MFTSRAEYRILLRQDNADIRLTEKGYAQGLASAERVENLNKKKGQTAKLLTEVKQWKVVPENINPHLESLSTAPIKEKTSVYNLLKRPDITIEDILLFSNETKEKLIAFTEDIRSQVEITIKYEHYVEKEQKMADKIGNLEDLRINENLNYDMLVAMSKEGREKLKKVKPKTIGQASRISGVSPADISILMVYIGR